MFNLKLIVHIYLQYFIYIFIYKCTFSYRSIANKLVEHAKLKTYSKKIELRQKAGVASESKF